MQLSPEKVSLGKKFVNSLQNDVIIPAAKEASKNIVKSYIEKEAKSVLDNHWNRQRKNEVKKWLVKVKARVAKAKAAAKNK